METAQIVGTTADGRGIAHLSGTAVFVHGALEGETVCFSRRKKRRNYYEADLVEVLAPSSERVEPRCAVFGTCGGCSLQHISAAQQIELKQAVLLDNLKRIGAVEPVDVLPPVAGPVWGYRRKARLAVKYVTKKERVLVGFRERHKPYVVDMAHCDTLHPRIAGLLSDLAGFVATLSIRQRLPQIEATVGDNAAALVFRVLEPPSESDLERFAAFQQRHDVRVLLQPGGLDTIHPLAGSTFGDELYYKITGFEFRITFLPTDFLQVNVQVNARMVHQALELLAPNADSRVLDLYCGLGNFSLPFATRSGEVLGLEIDTSMVTRAQRNAAAAGLRNLRFARADLSIAEDTAAFTNYDLVILDPPRTGAQDVLDRLATMAPRKILYVSCHPGSLARDAHELVHRCGYELVSAGVMDMFGQTSHIESMALFQR